MGNREKLQKHLKKCGAKLGCYTDLIDKLNASNLSKIIANGYTSGFECDYIFVKDVKIFINRKPYICQIDCMIDDLEFDYNLITLDEYNSNYDTWLD